MKNPSAKYPENIDLFSTRYSLTTNAKGEKVYLWGELVNLGERINTPDGFEGQPSLSGDGKTLFFVLEEQTISSGQQATPHQH